MVEALERIDAVTDNVAWTLIVVMRGDKYPGVRARAAQAIGNICPASASVVPILTKAFLSDGHPGVRWQAAEALEKCAVNLQQAEATEALGSLREALMALSADNEPDIRINATVVQNVIQTLARELARK